MNKLREKFTKWYVRKGYTMDWACCDFGDGIANFIFTCPFLVKPLAYFLFSPCVYYGSVGFKGLAGSDLTNDDL